MPAPFATRVQLRPGERLDRSRFPGTLAYLPTLDLTFDRPVTLFVGENGSGKSTLLEAIALLSGFPASGGGFNEFDRDRGTEGEGDPSEHIRLAFGHRPQDGYFFRAELQAKFADLLDERLRDEEFKKPPYTRYGGRSLHRQSHGEAFLAVMKNRFVEGLFLLDEPESALSPQRQLTMLALMHRLVGEGNSQFIVATHSPILMTYPEAAIISFDEPDLPNISYEDTSHYQLTKGVLANPEAYWRHLVDDS